MKTPEIKNPFKKIALVLSICAILLWSALGAGTSLAWFADTSTELNNIFQFAEFKLKVEHLDDGDWETVTSETKIFNEDDLFEPGYVQVQYLRVKNEGTVPFRFQTAVIINDCVFATNVYGDVLKLAGLDIAVLHTPGHTPGSVCLLCEDSIFSGDTLFEGSCGRTDLPGGSYSQIMESLKRLGQLEGDYYVCPGHDRPSTLEQERQTNFFLVEAMNKF